MIKAIIALINKWAYRCEHDFEEIDQGNLNRNDGSTKGRVYVYRCKKCCEFRTHKFYT